MEKIPVIDIHPFRSGSQDGKLRVARAVDHACREIGFLVLVGHGLPQDLVDRSHAAARAFFDLAVDQKRAVATAPGSFLGYHGVAAEALASTRDQETPPDLKESFTVGAVDRTDDSYFTSDTGKMYFPAQPWPAEVPALREAFVPLYRAFDALAIDVMRIFALALGLPMHFFDRAIDKSIGAVRVLSYPEQKERPAPGQLRAGAHTDYGSLTFLSMEDAPGGLEVDRGGVWEEVHVPSSSLVCNLGDLMARWTNDAWVSTYHRVANPPPDASGSTRRQSIVFFHQPNYDAEVIPLPTCVGPDRPSKYERTTSGEHLYMQMTKARNIVPT